MMMNNLYLLLDYLFIIILFYYYLTLKIVYYLVYILFYLMPLIDILVQHDLLEVIMDFEIHFIILKSLFDDYLYIDFDS